MSNPQADKIAGIEWIENGHRAHFESPRGWGVRRANRFLSFSGVRPSVWQTKTVAQEIATTIVDDGTLHWIEIAPR
ncbi:MAG TPA: hypothetical protein VEF72_12085 [Mycobacterium sp.]|nr:hypothetical protein [Mycobacterium sp.]